MLDHVTISVADYARSKAFYLRVLGALEITLLFEKPGPACGGMQAGFGSGTKPAFWISQGKAAGGPVHIAFGAKSREAVDAFYAAALAAGGRDNGPPGLRPQYHPLYYGAFVRDPDGNNIEAVHKEWERPAIRSG